LVFKIFDFLRDFLVLGTGRGMWGVGTSVEKIVESDLGSKKAGFRVLSFEQPAPSLV